MSTIQPVATKTRQMDGNQDLRRGVVPTHGAPGLWFDAPLSAVIHDHNCGTLFEDRMDSLSTVASRYATIADGAGALAYADSRGGAGSLATGAVDNDEVYVSSLLELFDLGAGLDIWFEADVQWTATGTADKESFLLGLSDNAAANLITDAGALAASFDGIGFFKGEDDTHIAGFTSDATAQTSDNVAAVGAGVNDGTTNRLGFRWDPDGGAASGEGRATFYLNGVAVVTRDITRPASALLHVVYGAKAHEAAAKAIVLTNVKCLQSEIPPETARNY